MLKIITDSASDMPQYIVECFNLHVIPTPVVIDGIDYWMTSAAISKPITSIPLCLRKRSAPMQNITTA